MQKNYSGQVSGLVPCSGEPLLGSFADPGAISPASVERYAVAGMAGSHYDGLVSVSRAKRTVLLTRFFQGQGRSGSADGSHDDVLPCQMPMSVSTQTMVCGWQRSLGMGEAM